MLIYNLDDDIILHELIIIGEGDIIGYRYYKCNSVSLYGRCRI